MNTLRTTLLARPDGRLAWLLPLAILWLALIALYHEVLGFGYVWDDVQLFIYSSDLRGDTVRLGRIFEPVLWQTTYFRPLVMLSFVLEFKAFGVSSAASHAVNLGLFAANVALVYALALRVLASQPQGRRIGFAALAAALYLVSPVQLESVAWVAGRFDLMCTTFVLLGLYAAIALRSAPGAAMVAGLSFYLALSSKEMAVTFPAVLFLWTWVTVEQPRPTLLQHCRALWRDTRSRWIFIALGIAFAAYLVTRVVALPQFIHADKGVLAHLTPVTWLSMIGHTILFYARQIVFPFADISPLHHFEVANLSAAAVWTGVAVVLASVAAIVRFALWQRRTWVLWLAIVLVSLMPVLHFIPLTIGNSIGHERFLALPFALFCVAVAACLAAYVPATVETARYRTYGVVIVLAWLVVSVLNVQVTLPLWRSDLLLWKWAFERNRSDEKARHLYFNAAIRAGQLELYEKDARPPKSGDEKLQHAYYLLRKQKPQEALAVLIERLDDAKDPLTHSYYPPHFQVALLAEAFVAVKDFQNALAASEATIQMAPDYPPGYLYKSFALYGLNRNKEADEAFDITRRHLREVAVGEAEAMRASLLDQLKH
jgi:hypothetical protein